MKKALSKALICGVMASSFVMVNCQKAPNRPVQAEVTPNAQQAAGAAAILPQCSPAIVTANTERRAIITTMIGTLNDVNGQPPALSEEKKQEVLGQAEQVKTKTDEMATLIEALPLPEAEGDGAAASNLNEEAAAAPKATGCKIANNPDITIAGLREENSRIGTRVRLVTEQANALEQGAQLEVIQQQQPTAPGALAAGAEVLVATAEMANILKDPNSETGASFIMDGAVKNTGHDAAIADANKTSCVVSVEMPGAAVDAVLKVLPLPEALVIENTRSVLKLPIQVGSETGELSCSIENASKVNVAAAMAAITRTLGNLIKPKPTEIVFANDAEMLIADVKLATALKDRNNGTNRSVIMDANVTTAADADAYGALIEAAATKTFCLVSSAVATADVDSVLKIESLGQNLAETDGRKTLEITIKVGAESGTLQCWIAPAAAENVEAAAASVRASFGAMVKAKPAEDATAQPGNLEVEN